MFLNLRFAIEHQEHKSNFAIHCNYNIFLETKQMILVSLTICGISSLKPWMQDIVYIHLSNFVCLPNSLMALIIVGQGVKLISEPSALPANPVSCHQDRSSPESGFHDVPWLRVTGQRVMGCRQHAVYRPSCFQASLPVPTAKHLQATLQ